MANNINLYSPEIYAKIGTDPVQLKIYGDVTPATVTKAINYLYTDLHVSILSYTVSNKSKSSPSASNYRCDLINVTVRFN